MPIPTSAKGNTNCQIFTSTTFSCSSCNNKPKIETIEPNINFLFDNRWIPNNIISKGYHL